MATLSMVYDVFARDRASATFARTGTEAEAMGRKVAAAAKALGAIALVDAGYHAVKMAADFQQATNLLVTAAGETTQNLGKVRQGILDISATTGTGFKPLTDGIYTIEKAGYRGADALNILRASSEGAREEGANLATVTNAVTSVMASYHLNSGDAVSVTNQLKTAAGEAKTTMEAFSGSLSTVLPIASANHIAFADVAGALATLTQHGTSADEATQELANTIRNLSAPNAVARKEMAQLGIDSVQVSQQLGQRGLTGTLALLSDTVLHKMGPSGTVLLNTFNQSQQAAKAADTMLAALPPAARKLGDAFKAGTISLAEYRKQARALPGEQGTLALQFAQTYQNAHGFQDALKAGGPAAQTYTNAIKAMTGGATGLNTTLQITGENLAGTEERTKRIADSAKGAGKDVSGWASTQKLFNVQMDIARQRIEVLGVKVGTALLPAVTAAAGALGDMFGFVGDHSSVFGVAAAVLLTYAVGLKAITLATKAWTAVTKAQVAMQTLLNGEMAANPIGIVIVAIAALVVGVIYAYKHFKTFHDIVNGVFNFLKDHWKLVAVIVLGPIGVIIDAIVTFHKQIAQAFHDVVQWGKDFAHGLSVAFRDVSGAVGAVGRFFSRMGHDVSVIVSGTVGAVSRFFRRMAADVTGAVNSVVSFVSRHWRLLIVLFTGPIGFVVDVIYKYRTRIGRIFEDIYHLATRAIGLLVRVVVAYFEFLYRYSIAPVLRFTGDALKLFLRFERWLGDSIRWVVGLVVGFFVGLAKDAGRIIAAFVRMVSDNFTQLWRGITGITSAIWHGVVSLFDSLRKDVVNIATDIWHKVSDPFEKLWSGLKLGFETAVAAMKTAWDKLKGIFADPINFFIQYVYDDAIVKVWNWVMDVVGEKGAKLNPVDKIKLDAGGGLSGPNRGDDRLAWVGGGEHMLTAEEVAAAGGHDAVAAWRAALVGHPVRVMGDGSGRYIWGGGVVRKGLGALGDAAGAVGGVLGDAGHAVTHAVGDVAGALGHIVRGALADGASPILNGAIDAIAGMIPGGDSWSKVPVGLAHGVVNKVMDWLRGQDSADAALTGDFGGPPGTSWPDIVAVMRMGGVPFTPPSPGQLTVGGHSATSLHYLGEAVDFTGPDLGAIARFWERYAGSLLELIYSGDGGHFVKNGKHVPASFYSAVLAEHFNHVHVGATDAAMQRILHPNTGGAGVQRWAGVVAQALGLNHLPQSLAGRVLAQMATESSGNPNAVQGAGVNDINARTGNWARGLMQVIPPTFAAYHVAGTSGSIMDPLANVAAALNYARHRYGPTLAGLGQGHGYATGGWPRLGEAFWVGERGPELLSLGTTTAHVRSNAESRQLVGAGGGGPLLHVENWHDHSGVNVDLALRRALFLQQSGGHFT